MCICASVSWPARTYLDKLCRDRGCRLDDLPGPIEDRDGERIREIRAVSDAWWWEWYPGPEDVLALTVLRSIVVDGTLTSVEFKSHLNERATESNSETYVLRGPTGPWRPTETIKSFCCVKSDGDVYYGKITKWSRKFDSSCNYLDQVGLKPVDFEAVLPALQANPLSSTWRVSDDLGIFQVVCHFHDQDKNNWSCRIVPKIRHNF